MNPRIHELRSNLKGNASQTVSWAPMIDTDELNRVQSKCEAEKFTGIQTGRVWSVASFV